MDVYGSPVIEKALDVADKITKRKLISELEGSVVKCAMNYGARVIQSAIMKADDVTKRKLISELEGSVVKVATDVHGFHVIRKVLNIANDVTKGKVMSELVGIIVDKKELQSEEATVDKSNQVSAHSKSNQSIAKTGRKRPSERGRRGGNL